MLSGPTSARVGGAANSGLAAGWGAVSGAADLACARLPDQPESEPDERQPNRPRNEEGDDAEDERSGGEASVPIRASEAILGRCDRRWFCFESLNLLSDPCGRAGDAAPWAQDALLLGLPIGYSAKLPQAQVTVNSCLGLRGVVGRERPRPPPDGHTICRASQRIPAARTRPPNRSIRMGVPSLMVGTYFQGRASEALSKWDQSSARSRTALDQLTRPW